MSVYVFVFVFVCVRACVRVCVRACVRACVRGLVRDEGILCIGRENKTKTKELYVLAEDCEHQGQAARSKPASASPPTRRDQYKILIVDDSGPNRKLLETMLTRLGYTDYRTLSLA